MAAARGAAHPSDSGEPEVSFTTSARVANYAREAGLQSRQVMMLVARCALVKHLAEQYGDRFILKGGALLYHVYGTPRVSFLDTDYAENRDEGSARSDRCRAVDRLHRPSERLQPADNA